MNIEGKCANGFGLIIEKMDLRISDILLENKTDNDFDIELW